MVIGLGMIGVALTLLGILCTYVWRANGKLEERLSRAEERIIHGSERLEERLSRAEERIIQMLERIEEGHKEWFKGLSEMIEKQSEMLLVQARILERIEARR
jgi:3-hydroxyacyl-CoA dehydrogenase